LPRPRVPHRGLPAARGTTGPGGNACRPNRKKPKAPHRPNRREILADAKLRPIFGKDKVTMFEMNRYLAQHLK